MNKNYYEENYEEYYKNTIDADMSQMIEKFLSYLKPQSMILDAGCGVGRDTKVFIQKGYDVEAFDSSAQMCRISSEYTGQSTRQMRFEDMDYENQFDGVWACASLLHVTREDLLDVFRRLEKALKKGGVLYASFKLGYDYSEKGRQFVCLTEDEARHIADELKDLVFYDCVITNDVRQFYDSIQWINLFLVKK